MARTQESRDRQSAKMRLVWQKRRAIGFVARKSPDIVSLPALNGLKRRIVEAVIARTAAGKNVAIISLASEFSVTRKQVALAARFLCHAGYLRRTPDEVGIDQLTPLVDADGRPWQRDSHLIRTEIRDGVTVHVCPTRWATGALIWPQKLTGRARA
jgi:hypothetical protein